MILTEKFCDEAFKSIRFNKRNMEVTLCTIQSEWVSKLYVYNPSEVAVINDIINTIYSLVHYRKHWDKMQFWYKKRVLGLLYRNKRLFLDSKAMKWSNIDRYDILQGIGNSYWNADIRK